MGLLSGLGSNEQTTNLSNNFINNSGIATIDDMNRQYPAPVGILQSNEISHMLQYNTKITIVKGIFTEAPEVQGAVNRTHAVNTSGSSAVNAINTFSEYLREGNIPESKLMELGSQIINTSAEHQGVVAIPYGWETKRLRFLLVFRIEDAGRTFYETLTGYTDFYELSQNNQVNPQMRLYFNNVIKLRPHHQQDMYGNLTERLSLMSTRQILTMRDGATGFHSGDWNTPATRTMVTPTSVFETLEIEQYMRGYAGTTIDTRTKAGRSGSGISLVNRTNTLGANFFGNVVKAFNNSITSHNISSNTSADLRMQHIYTEAADLAKQNEASVIEDHVLNNLRMNTDYAIQGSISWGDFCSVFKEASQICTLIKSKQVTEQLMPRELDMINVNESESWTSAHFTTVKAQTLLTAIPAVMMDCLLSDITFTATNMTLSGLDPLAVNVTSASSFLGEGMNNTNLVNLFIQQFRTRIHPILSDNDDKQYIFMMRCDVLGELRMTLRYDGIPYEYTYTAGVFADHLFTPLVTSSPTHLSHLANDLGNILDNGFNH